LIIDPKIHPKTYQLSQIRNCFWPNPVTDQQLQIFLKKLDGIINIAVDHENKKDENGFDHEKTEFNRIIRGQLASEQNLKHNLLFKLLKIYRLACINGDPNPKNFEPYADYVGDLGLAVLADNQDSFSVSIFDPANFRRLLASISPNEIIPRDSNLLSFFFQQIDDALPDSLREWLETSIKPEDTSVWKNNFEFREILNTLKHFGIKMPNFEKLLDAVDEGWGKAQILLSAYPLSFCNDDDLPNPSNTYRQRILKRTEAFLQALNFVTKLSSSEELCKTIFKTEIAYIDKTLNQNISNFELREKLLAYEQTIKQLYNLTQYP